MRCGTNDPALPAVSYVGLLFDAGPALDGFLAALMRRQNGWRQLSAGVCGTAFRDGMDWVGGGGCRVWGVERWFWRKKIWLVPLVSDALSFVIWLASFGSNRIRWGCRYLVRDGQNDTDSCGQGCRRIQQLQRLGRGKVCDFAMASQLTVS